MLNDAGNYQQSNTLLTVHLVKEKNDLLPTVVVATMAISGSKNPYRIARYADE